MYEDEDIENIEFFAKRLIELVNLYKANKGNKLLCELINEGAYNIIASLK